MSEFDPDPEDFYPRYPELGMLYREFAETPKKRKQQVECPPAPKKRKEAPKKGVEEEKAREKKVHERTATRRQIITPEVTILIHKDDDAAKRLKDSGWEASGDCVRKTSNMTILNLIGTLKNKGLTVEHIESPEEVSLARGGHAYTVTVSSSKTNVAKNIDKVARERTQCVNCNNEGYFSSSSRNGCRTITTCKWCYHGFFACVGIRSLFVRHNPDYIAWRALLDMLSVGDFAIQEKAREIIAEYSSKYD